ncbi:MAG: peptidoglycan hydrolase, partial [Chloroflexota bacterium]|nr:peptidoglycan hydrolase [Chloroflexota bacterium]
MLLFSLGTGYTNSPSYAQTNSRHFPETGHTVQGRFLEYWEQNGGLPQQGYPISEEMREVSAVDGKTYTVQYFERAVFELHPENQRPYDVLLSLLGSLEYREKFLEGALGQVPN